MAIQSRKTIIMRLRGEEGVSTAAADEKMLGTRYDYCSTRFTEKGKWVEHSGRVICVIVYE